MIELKRYWINQPSTLQPFHKLHGTNVLGIRGNPAQIWFLSGNIITQLIPNLCLSNGWKE